MLSRLNVNDLTQTDLQVKVVYMIPSGLSQREFRKTNKGIDKKRCMRKLAQYFFTSNMFLKYFTSFPGIAMGMIILNFKISMYANLLKGNCCRFVYYYYNSYCLKYHFIEIIIQNSSSSSSLLLLICLFLATNAGHGTFLGQVSTNYLRCQRLVPGQGWCHHYHHHHHHHRHHHHHHHHHHHSHCCCFLL